MPPIGLVLPALVLLAAPHPELGKGLWEAWRLVLPDPAGEFVADPAGQPRQTREPGRRQRGASLLRKLHGRLCQERGPVHPLTLQAWALHGLALDPERQQALAPQALAYLVQILAGEGRLRQQRGIDCPGRLPFLEAEYLLRRLLRLEDPEPFNQGLALAQRLEGAGGPLALDLWLHRLSFQEELSDTQSREAFAVYCGATASPARHRFAQALLATVSFFNDLEPGHYHPSHEQTETWDRFLQAMAVEAAAYPEDAGFRADLAATQCRRAAMSMEAGVGVAAGIAGPTGTRSSIQPWQAFRTELDTLALDQRFTEAGRRLEARLLLAPWEGAGSEPIQLLTEFWLKGQAWESLDRLWISRYLPQVRADQGFPDPLQVRELPDRVERLGQGALAQRMRMDFLFAAYRPLPGELHLRDLLPLSRRLEHALWQHAPVAAADTPASCLLKALAASGEGSRELKLTLLEATHQYREALAVLEGDRAVVETAELVAKALGYAEQCAGDEAAHLLTQAQAYLGRPGNSGCEPCTRLVFTAHLQKAWGLLHQEAGRDEQALAAFQAAFQQVAGHLGAAADPGNGALDAFTLSTSYLLELMGWLGQAQIKQGRFEACLASLRTCQNALRRESKAQRLPAGGPPPPPPVWAASVRRGTWEALAIPWYDVSLAQIRVRGLAVIQRGRY